MKRALAASALAVAAIGATASVALADGDTDGATWKVTVENVSTGFQPLSPPVFAVHDKAVRAWQVGTPASAALAAVAEDANNAVLVSTLDALDAVRQVAVAPGGPLLPGASTEFTVTTESGRDRLSLVSMLVNTNDGFTGIDSVKLRGDGTTVEVMAYDAGTEANTEAASDIPGPCCGSAFARAPEGGLVAPHPGIQGGGDLDPATYGWQGPVARITVEKVG